MKAKYVPFIVTVIALGVSTVNVPCAAQLPPTNMGKYVHQPGDNQYSDATQHQRHPVAAPPQVQVMSLPAATGATSAPPKPDATLEPVAADEPVPPAAFPPLPDRLDLPVGNQGAWTRAASAGSYDTGGAAPGVAGGGGAITPTYHQHYGHVAPGAYLQKPSGSGYYKAVDPGTQGSGGSGYYKARTPGSDYYSTNTAGVPGSQPPPQYTGASGKDLKALGREPRLNDRQEDSQAPDAPTPVVVSQSTTQDLSLPEDEFSYRYSNKKKGLRAPPVVRGPLNAVGGMTGIRF